MKRGAGGYTIVELVVVIGIFSIVMTLISVSSARIVASSGQIVKSTETDIGGLIGLELLRNDLGFAGFGLFWSLPAGLSYSEAQGSGNAAELNDSPDKPPRAFAMVNDTGFNGSDYLALKGTALGMTGTSRSWSYLTYSSTGALIKPAKSELELTPGKGERVIVIRSGIRDALPVRELVADGNSFAVSFDYPLPGAFQPKSRQDSYLVYGVAPPPKNGEDLITFPFNRADYYLARSDGSSSICAHGTGMLYRGLVSQKGNLKPFPILDCVADLQVVFLMDSNLDGEVDVITNDIKACSASQLREELKEVRVYILAQLGKRDAGYSYPVPDPERAMVLGTGAAGRVWKRSELDSTLGGDWRQYRWKLYTIAVQPENLY